MSFAVFDNYDDAQKYNADISNLMGLPDLYAFDWFKPQQRLDNKWVVIVNPDFFVDNLVLEEYTDSWFPRLC